jgi:hypothetical protein
MPATFAHRALETHRHLVSDGRSVTLRWAVPSDAPRISVAFEASRDVAWGHDIVAFDDHGAIVGHAGSSADIAVVPDWSGCGLESVLASAADPKGELP